MTGKMAYSVLLLYREGFVVDIVGEVRSLFGIKHNYLIMEKCWISIVEGDIGGDIPDWGY